MKANLIINLVAAHSSGNESQFESALSDLIHDEEKKGNAQLALSLKNAYSPDKHSQSSMISPMSTMSFSVQSVANLPKDKDSTLDLVEILQPTVRLKDVALSEKAQETIQEIIKEQNNAQELMRIGVTPTNRILFCGPPGCGKTMIAQRISTILPEMSEEECLEVTKIYSISGLLSNGHSLVKNRPFRAPHHNASLNALIGGGVNAMPGEVSLAHNGVLFLDELAEKHWMHFVSLLKIRKYLLPE